VRVANGNPHSPEHSRIAGRLPSRLGCVENLIEHRARVGCCARTSHHLHAGWLIELSGEHVRV
jgi:hypothetical protein